jgi:hypothetical protein
MPEWNRKDEIYCLRDHIMQVRAYKEDISDWELQIDSGLSSSLSLLLT